MDPSMPPHIRKERLKTALGIVQGRGGDMSLPEANEALNTFREAPESLDMLGTLIDSQSHELTFYALCVLEHHVKRRWYILPEERRRTIRQSVMQLYRAFIGDAALVDDVRGPPVVLNQLNSVYVTLASKDWPHAWPTCISDILEAGALSSGACMNSLRVLKLLGEVIFVEHGSTLTRQRVVEMSATFMRDRKAILCFCGRALESTEHRLEVHRVALETVYTFFGSLEDGAYVERILSVILQRFLGLRETCAPTIMCIRELLGH